MLKGGSYEEVGRWLWNFATSHAKRESPRVEAVVETEGEREGSSYGIRLRIGDHFLPPLDRPPVEVAYPNVAEGKASFAWCDALARRIRDWARELLDTVAAQPPRPA